MEPSFFLAFLIPLFAGLSTALGGLIAISRKELDNKFLASSLGFAAGVMLYVSFMEIMPEANEILEESYGHGSGSILTLFVFFLGISLFLGIERYLFSIREKNHSQPNAMAQIGVLTALAVVIHNIPEGFAAFLVGLSDLSLAIPMALAIMIHSIPQGMAIAIPIREGTASKKKAFMASLYAGSAQPIGAVLLYLLLGRRMDTPILGFSFALVAGIMVVISLIDLLPAARKTGYESYAHYALFLGMLVTALSLVFLHS